MRNLTIKTILPAYRNNQLLKSTVESNSFTFCTRCKNWTSHPHTYAFDGETYKRKCSRKQKCSWLHILYVRCKQLSSLKAGEVSRSKSGLKYYTSAITLMTHFIRNNKIQHLYVEVQVCHLNFNLLGIHAVNSQYKVIRVVSASEARMKN